MFTGPRAEYKYLVILYLVLSFTYHCLHRTNKERFIHLEQGTGRLVLVDSSDLIKLLVSHPKSKGLLSEATTAFVQRETGAIAGIERAVQAATDPSAGQKMLQDGYHGAIANGVSREEYSITTERNGHEIAQKRVERGILLPNGQGVHIQQAVEQVCVSQGDLGKRKLQDDLELDERRLSLDERRMQLQTQSIENDKQRVENDKQRAENRVSVVLKCTDALFVLNPRWKSDQRMVLQFQEVLTNSVLHDSSNGAANSGNIGGQIMAPSALASISIGQIALEMGVALKHGDSVKIGKHLSGLYKDKHGQFPSQHKQVVQGAVRNVNSYTQGDRELMETAIRACCK